MGIRQLFTDLYYKTTFGKKLLHPLLQIRNNLIPQEKLLSTRFKRLLGYSLNLNNPRSLNEKIQWLKIHDRKDLHITCADKFKVRPYVMDKIGQQYLIPLILETQNIDEIVPENFPDYPFIIKTNHDSGGIKIIRDKNNVDWPETRKKLKVQLDYSYDTGKGEWHYLAIEPRLVIEKLLLDEEGQVPPDFKLHCMNGRVEFVQVDLDRATKHKRNLYNREWKLLPVLWRHENGKNIEKPKVFSKMIELAELLAEDFTYARVDLYNLDERIYFGEITFYPGSGCEKFIPEKWDFKFGELLNLPIQNKI